MIVPGGGRRLTFRRPSRNVVQALSSRYTNSCLLRRRREEKFSGFFGGVNIQRPYSSALWPVLPVHTTISLLPVVHHCIVGPAAECTFLCTLPSFGNLRRGLYPRLFCDIDPLTVERIATTSGVKCLYLLPDLVSLKQN